MDEYRRVKENSADAKPKPAVNLVEIDSTTTDVVADEDPVANENTDCNRRRQKIDELELNTAAEMKRLERLADELEKIPTGIDQRITALYGCDYSRFEESKKLQLQRSFRTLVEAAIIVDSTKIK